MRQFQRGTVVFFDYASEIFVVGDGDQGLQVSLGQLTPQDHRRTTDSEDSGVAASVTECAVGGARENLAAVAAEELDSLTGFGFHDSFSLLSELICVEGKEKLELEDSRKREN